MALIGIALTTQSPIRGGATPPPGDWVSIEAFSRDRVLFDGGAAFGRASASVPLRGRAAAGRGVEARAVGEEGAPVTGWTRIAAAGEDGAWSGALAVPRSPGWMRAEVRLEGAPEAAARGVLRFGVGHVIAVWGQSEVQQMLLANQDNTPASPLLADDRVQIVWHDREVLGSGAAGVRHKHLTRADPHTGSVGAMADALMAERPGERFAILFQAMSGTHIFNLVKDEPEPSRAWVDDEAVHRFATRDGQHVGFAAASWFAAPANLGAAYEAALMPIFTGRDVEGRPVAIPGTHSWRGGTTQTERFDHWFGDLYDYAHTRWVPYGPHRFEPEGELRNATTRANGDGYDKLQNIEAARRSWRSMSRNPHALNARGEAIFLPITVEPLTYLNGERDPVTGGWEDITHPASDTLDGLARFGRLTAHAVLRSGGLTSWRVPEFDGCAWDPAGAFVELWSSAGPVTTTRRVRGLPRPAAGGDPSRAHWAEVVGFEIDGRPATRAEITAAGRVRIHPASGAFTGASVLTFGAGGATGALNRQADLTAGLWMDLPIVEAQAAGLEGIPVRPLPDAARLASTVATGGAPSAYFTLDGGDAHFAGPALGEGVSGITVEMVVRLREQTITGLQEIFELTAASLAFEVDMRAGRRQFRVTMKDSAGARLVAGLYSPLEALPVDRWTTIRLVALHDQGDGTGFARVSVDDASVFPPAGNPSQGRFATTTGRFPAIRSFEVLRGGARLDVARVAIWKSARPDGARPATAPFKLIEGDAARANADPWKAPGTTAFT